MQKHEIKKCWIFWDFSFIWRKSNKENESLSYKNNCGLKTIIKLEKLDMNEIIIKFIFKQRGLHCYDFFINATSIYTNIDFYHIFKLN